MKPEEEMICARPDCTNRRSTKAKYCGSRCRKAAFKESHDVAPPPRLTNAGADTNIPITPVKPKGCGHFIGASGICTQKGCYGIPTKKGA